MHRRSLRRAAPLGAVAAVVSVLAACGDSSGPPPPPASIQPVAGDNQQATVGTALPVVPVVRVVNTEGDPSEGVVVTFTTAPGSGIITGPIDTTDAQGRAQVESWTLGTGAGQQMLNATTSGGLATTVTATALPGQPIALDKQAGDLQTGEVGTALGLEPSVLVRDQFGNPVPGVPVRFTVVGSAGSVAVPNAVTDASGIASAGPWTLGPQVGTQRVTASLPSGTAVSFTATAEAGAPAALEKVVGDGQSGAAGAAVPIPPTVRVVDSFGNVLSGVPVTFAVASGGGSVIGASAVTDAQGNARVGSWELGPVIGQQTLTATSPGLPTVTFTVTAVASSFSIEVRFGGSPSNLTLQAVAAAAARWQEVIVGDLPDQSASIGANFCGIPHPSVNEVVDDILIFAIADSIDGRNGALAGATWCRLRSAGNGGLPYAGVFLIDSADVAAMESAGILTDVIIHEIGHALGIGSLWDQFGLRTGSCTADPFFNGQNATDRFFGIGGSHPNGPPIHNQDGAGSICSHWRESAFGNELMSPFISGSNNPLSVVTIGSLHDMGYLVDYNAADPFSFGAAAWHALAAPTEPWEIVLQPGERVH